MYIKDFADFLKKENTKNPLRLREAIIFNHFLFKLVGLATTSINWINLPTEIPERILERNLLFNVRGAFFKDEVMDQYIGLPAAAAGKLNAYGLPNYVRAYGKNGYNYVVDIAHKKGVLIFDNYNDRALINDLVFYAQRMTDILTTLNVNLRQQRIPLIFKTTAQGKQVIDRAMQASDAGAYACAVDKTLSQDIGELLYQPVPFLAPGLQEQLEKIWGEALTFLGIVNVNEKAERLNSFEVGSQIEETVSQLNTRLKPRQEACRQINEIYGLNVDVMPASWVLARSRSDTLDENVPEEREPDMLEASPVDPTEKEGIA